MKNKINTLLAVESLINLFIVLFIFASPRNENYYLIEKNNLWLVLVPFFLFILCHALEYVITKKFLKSKILKSMIYCAEIIFVDVMLKYQYDSTFFYLIFISLFNILICETSTIIFYVYNRKRENEDGDSGLPYMWFSYSSFILYWVFLTIIPICGMCFVIFVKWSSYVVRLIIATLSCSLVLASVIIILKDGFNRMIYKYESTLDYMDFNKQIKKLYSKSLSVDTINYIKIFESKYQFNINTNQSTAMLKDFVKCPKDKKGILLYYDVTLKNAIFTEDKERYEELIGNYDEPLISLNSRDKNIFMFEKEYITLLKKLFIDKDPDEKLLMYVLINNKDSLYIKLEKSFILFSYYYLKKDDKNLEYYNLIEENKNYIPSLYELTEKIKDEFTIKEKSCGAVVYKVENDEIYILIEEMIKGHISIPKGHVEENETEIETALREIKEETGLVCKIDNSFRDRIEYSPYPYCLKEVIFFVTKYVNGDIVPQPEEVKEAKFVTVNEALRLLTYDSDKKVVKNAVSYINTYME